MPDYVEYVRIGAGGEAVPIRDPEAREILSAAGLGTAAKLLTDSDDLAKIMSSGWYRWDADSIPSNVPDGLTNYMSFMRVWGTTGSTCLQEFADITDSTNSGTKAQRVIYGSNVLPLEWINPPMLEGVEYRTAERFGNKPVYCKLLDFGSAPDTSYKTMYIADGITRLVRIEGFAMHTDGECVPITTIGKCAIAGTTSFRLDTQTNYSNWTCYPAVYYTK